MGLAQRQNGGMGLFTFNQMKRELIDSLKRWAVLAALLAFSIYVWIQIVATLILK
jgi:hypothetical protein